MHWFDAFAVLDPKGTISLAERGLMIHAVEFMLIVAIPVYILLFFFAWRYRDRSASGTPDKKGARIAYAPNWESGPMEELIWWAIPFEIILILGALTWTSTHALAPGKPLSASTTPMVVDVVALPWKWLFIYPSLGVASVNQLEMPVGQPVDFKVTADAPMNSFWIPQLGGQIYAMTGMVNDLNLVADEPGAYAGSSSNYSGSGFAQMKFTATAVSQSDFDAWVSSVKGTDTMLDRSAYTKLAAPSVMSAPTSYAKVDPSLYDTIVKQFMDPYPKVMED